MILYHGSYTEIEAIDLVKAKPFKDFGVGFYATKIRKQAEFWAKRLGKDYGNEDFVTEFEFTEYARRDEEIKVLKI